MKARLSTQNVYTLEYIKGSNTAWWDEVFEDFKEGEMLDGRFGLLVYPNRARSFVVDYSFNGKRRRDTIGTVKEGGGMALPKARKEALKIIQRAKDGIDPRIDTHVNIEPCVSELAETYWEGHVKSTGKSNREEFTRFVLKGAPNAEKPFKGFSSYMKTRRAMDVIPADISLYLQTLSSASNRNAALRQIRAMFNWAIRMQIINIKNPATPIRNEKIVKDVRRFTPEEISAVLEKIYSPPLKQMREVENKRDIMMNATTHMQNVQMIELSNFLKMILFTMARPNEILHAEFSHFDVRKNIWHKHNTKGIKLSKAYVEAATRSIPVHPVVIQAIEMQYEIQKNRYDNFKIHAEPRYIFCSPKKPLQPRQNFCRSLKEFKEAAGVDFEPYDLKRIAISSLMAGNLANRDMLSHYVDHKGNLTTTMIYDLGMVEPLRGVADNIETAIKLIAQTGKND